MRVSDVILLLACLALLGLTLFDVRHSSGEECVTGRFMTEVEDTLLVSDQVKICTAGEWRVEVTEPVGGNQVQQWP